MSTTARAASTTVQDDDAVGATSNSQIASLRRQDAAYLNGANGGLSLPVVATIMSFLGLADHLVGVARVSKFFLSVARTAASWPRCGVALRALQRPVQSQASCRAASQQKLQVMLLDQIYQVRFGRVCSEQANFDRDALKYAAFHLGDFKRPNASLTALILHKELVSPVGVWLPYLSSTLVELSLPMCHLDASSWRLPPMARLEILSIHVCNWRDFMGSAYDTASKVIRDFPRLCQVQLNVLGCTNLYAGVATTSVLINLLSSLITSLDGVDDRIVGLTEFPGWLTSCPRLRDFRNLQVSMRRRHKTLLEDVIAAKIPLERHDLTLWGGDDASNWSSEIALLKNCTKLTALSVDFDRSLIRSDHVVCMANLFGLTQLAELHLFGSGSFVEGDFCRTISRGIAASLVDSKQVEFSFKLASTGQGSAEAAGGERTKCTWTTSAASMTLFDLPRLRVLSLLDCSWSRSSHKLCRECARCRAVFVGSSVPDHLLIRLCW